ncbi:four helix bundle protein [bacterium]|nr:four helix bundle protein [candidate division CSSED10-310 bacterium]
MASKRFEDVVAWQHARTLTNEILSVTGSLDSFRKEPELSRRLQNTAFDIQSEIARSFTSSDSSRFIEGLKIALASTEALRSLLFIAADRECINLRIFERLSRSVLTCSSKIQELLAFVKQQLKSRKITDAQPIQQPTGAQQRVMGVQRTGISSRQASQQPQRIIISQAPDQPTSRLAREVPTEEDFFSNDFDFVSGSGHGDSDSGGENLME